MTSEAMSGRTENSELASVTTANAIQGTGSSESVSMSVTELTEDVEISELASLAMADATILGEVCVWLRASDTENGSSHYWKR